MERPIKSNLRLNDQITASEVRVIDEKGEQVGVITIEAALQLAHERELDLVEVAPEASPPVCRLQDFDKLRYERKRQQEKARKKSKKQETKETRLSPNTSENDIRTKMKLARKFLEAGDKVRILVKFVGREITHPELGEKTLAFCIDEVKDVGEVELAPAFEGKKLAVTLRPLNVAPKP